MASIGEVLSELADVQPCLTSDSYEPEVKESMVEQLAAKIHSLRTIDAAASYQLMTAIRSLGAAPELVALLEGAVNDSILNMREGRKGSQVQQLLTRPYNYLTQSDWLKIDDPSLAPSEVSRVIQERYSLLGLRCFDEQTYRCAVAVILSKVLAVTGQWPKY